MSEADNLPGALTPPSVDPDHPRRVPAPARHRRRQRRSLPLLKRRRLRRGYKSRLRGVPHSLVETDADRLLAEIANAGDVIGRGYVERP